MRNIVKISFFFAVLKLLLLLVASHVQQWLSVAVTLQLRHSLGIRSFQDNCIQPPRAATARQAFLLVSVLIFLLDKVPVGVQLTQRLFQPRPKTDHLHGLWKDAPLNSALQRRCCTSRGGRAVEVAGDLGSRLNCGRAHVGRMKQQELAHIPLVDLEVSQQLWLLVDGGKHQDMACIEPRPHCVQYYSQRLHVHLGGGVFQHPGAVCVVVLAASGWIHHQQLLPTPECHPQQLIAFHLWVLCAGDHHTPDLLITIELPLALSLQRIRVQEVHCIFGGADDAVFQSLQALELLPRAHDLGVAGLRREAAVRHVEHLQDSILQP